MKKITLLVAIYALSSMLVKSQALLETSKEVHYGLNLGIPNEEGSVKFFDPRPGFVQPPRNVFGLHSFNDASPVSIGGDDVYFVKEQFNGIFKNESSTFNNGWNRVFIPGQLRIGTTNTAWNNFKVKIVTDPTNAPFINGLKIEHTNINTLSYGFLMTVESSYTNAFVIENNSLPSANKEVFKVDGTGKLSCKTIVLENEAFTTTPTKEVFKVLETGKVYCTELEVAPGGTFPDYVFEADYKLRSISELERYINKNGHLPNIPSAKEIEDRGTVPVAELQLQMLEKIEELSLYIIELKHENEKIRSQLNECHEN